MKNLLIACITATLLVGCSSKERTGLKESLVAKFKDDSDLKDYNLNPEDVADCVVDEITASLPVFGADPRREQYFQAYARFVSAASPADLTKAITESQPLFGTIEDARKSANIADHVMTCMGKAIAESDVRDAPRHTSESAQPAQQPAGPAGDDAALPPDEDGGEGEIGDQEQPAAAEEAQPDHSTEPAGAAKRK